MVMVNEAPLAGIGSPRRFFALPEPSRSSQGLGWRHIEAHRYDALLCRDLTLPALPWHLISVHLLRPTLVDGRFGGRIYSGRSAPGNLMIMSAGQASVWQCAEPLDELHILLDPAVVDRMAADIGLAGARLVDGVALVDPVMADIARQLLAELANPGLGTRQFADATADLLALHLLRRHSTAMGGAQTAPRLDMTARQLRLATAFVESHLGEELQLEAIAAAAGMSAFRFARAFKKATGHSPRQYVIGRRIELARELLRGSDDDLTDIAHRVGFATQSHFTSVFRQRCGITPKRFRDGLRG
jgi:AraC family transcriptional regulator